jgi:hypothetical protein
MIMPLAIMILKTFSLLQEMLNMNVMQHLRTEYLIRFIFFFFCATLIAAALLLAVRRMKNKPVVSATVDFSMLNAALVRYKRGFLLFFILLLLIIVLVMLFQATMFFLLQIDLWHDLPINQTSGSPRQIFDTLAGRLVLVNNSVFLDPDRLLYLLNSDKGQYMIQYLQTSHLILDVKSLP